MTDLNIEKIEQKQTKTVLTVSIDTGSMSSVNKDEAFKKLLIIGLLSGGSGNCVRQISKRDVSNEREFDFQFLKELQIEAEELIYSLNVEMERVEKFHTLNTETHKFY